MTYKKLKPMSEVELAYLAGLIDGEGTITLCKPRASSKYKVPQISMASTSYELIKIVADMTGIGHVSQKKKYQDHHSQSYTWQCTNSKQVIALLRALLPYLRESLKWKRAKKLVSEWSSVTQRNGKYAEEQEALKLRLESEFFSL